MKKGAPKGHPNWYKAKYGKITLKCAFPKCGKEFTIYERASRLWRSSKNYCSRSCARKNFSANGDAWKLIKEGTWLNILDEPINDLDLKAVEELL